MFSGYRRREVRLERGEQRHENVVTAGRFICVRDAVALVIVVLDAPPFARFGVEDLVLATARGQSLLPFASGST